MVKPMVITAIAVGLTAIGWTIASKIRFVRDYWKRCQSETLGNAHGVKSNSWLGSETAVWFRVNDVIMGGKSTSVLGTDSDGRLVFSGEINTNGGGFASMRTSEACKVKIPAGARSVKLAVEGDGQLWKANLGMSHSLMDSNPTFSHDFLTKPGQITTHTLSLSEFSAQRRGQTLEGFVLDPSKIQYVGLILSLVTQKGDPNPHFGDGPFKIVLHELEFE